MDRLHWLGHADRPKLSIAIDVQGEGFFLNPVVAKVLVTKVEKASLEADAGIVAGDEIIQVEGQTIIGRRARELQPLMKFNAGESRTLRLKHANGEQFEACITKPKNWLRGCPSVTAIQKMRNAAAEGLSRSLRGVGSDPRPVLGIEIRLGAMAARGHPARGHLEE